MAKFSRTVPPTDASGYTQAWHDALTEMGWVQTSDTGQVVPEDVSTPAANSVWGYSMWEPGDGLGGLVLKLRFFNSQTGSYVPLPRIVPSIGASSDGEGGLIGITWSDIASPTNTSVSAHIPQSSVLMVGGDATGFYAALGAGLDSSNTAYLSQSLIVDRSRDASGDPILGGAMMLLTGLPGAEHNRFHIGTPGGTVSFFTTNTSPLVYPFRVGTPDQDYSLSPDGATTPVYPTIVAVKDCPTWVSPLLVGVAPADQPLEFSANIAGKTRNYRRVHPVHTKSLSVRTARPPQTILTDSSDSWGWPMMLWED